MIFLLDEKIIAAPPEPVVERVTRKVVSVPYYEFKERWNKMSRAERREFLNTHGE